jgi:23S rRNA (guanosine2251-2'-O)-methyltransferase
MLIDRKIVFILDNVRSASNVGSIFRTADSLGISEIFLCGICATPPNKEILKTALGATESVAWQYFENTTLAIDALKLKDYKIIAIEQSIGSTMLDKLTLIESTNYAFVFGNEVEGVNQEVLNLVDSIIEIPQLGIKKSLNVAVTAGIVAWQCLSQNTKQ